MTGRVSVALCTFNGAVFIEAQLRSILAQAEEIGEIVVADDGSTDATLEHVRVIAAETREHGPEIRLLEGAGGLGVTKNFERAIAACRGELIALSDQDDVWLPGRLARQLAEFDVRPDLTLLYGDARLVDASGKPLGTTLFATLELTTVTIQDIHKGGAFAVLLRRNVVTGATVVFRRCLLDAALPIPRQWVHDEWLAIMAAAVGAVDALEEPVLDYRQHGSNEIGVQAPSLRNKFQRVLEPRGTRNQDLAVRSRLLLSKLRELPAVDSALLHAAEQKAEFEAFRAALPERRTRRLAAVLAHRLDYGRYASQGRLDMVRDLLQPA